MSNDTLHGQGGADVLYGGAGDDILSIGDTTFHRIEGGSGTDTLQLTGSNFSINLSNLGERVRGIEQIDLTGSGNNTLTLTQLDVLNLSDSSNRLLIQGDIGDVVVLTESGWQYQGVQAVGTDTYYSFSKDNAHLLIQETAMGGEFLYDFSKQQSVWDNTMISTLQDMQLIAFEDGKAIDFNWSQVASNINLVSHFF